MPTVPPDIGRAHHPLCSDKLCLHLWQTPQSIPSSAPCVRIDASRVFCEEKNCAIFPSWAGSQPASERSLIAEKRRRRDYGLHTIVHAPREAADRVDIVAIHGLNGHHLQT